MCDFLKVIFVYNNLPLNLEVVVCIVNINIRKITKTALFHGLRENMKLTYCLFGTQNATDV